jgi:hypothetical protein
MDASIVDAQVDGGPSCPGVLPSEGAPCAAGFSCGYDRCDGGGDRPTIIAACENGVIRHQRFGCVSPVDASTSDAGSEQRIDGSF